jgi:hypothetical protein
MDNLNLETLAGPQLVALYNEKAPLVGEKPVSKFSDRSTAIKRVRALLTKIGETKTVTDETDEDAGIPDFLKKDALYDRLQSEDRAHRIGQKHSVNYIDLIASGTVDEHILSSLRNKLDIASKITGDVSNPINPPAPAPKVKAEPKVQASPKPKVEKKVIERKPRGMRFFFPVADEIKNVRPGTHRATLVELLSTKEGASFEECQAATGWDKKTCYEGIRLLHSYVGYGMTQDAEGRIKLKTK